MLSKAQSSWLGVLMLAMLALLVTPVAAQTTPTPPQTPVAMPLAGQGPYTVGYTSKQFVDDSRDGRRLNVLVWYPAIAPDNPTATQKYFLTSQHGWLDATPDAQAAAYPLIIYSQGLGGEVEPDMESRLASQGYVVAGPLQHPDERQAATFVDRPLDILFMLDQLAAINLTDFGGVIDTDHVGVIGTSLGAYTTLALTGARFDPASASTWGIPGTPLFDVDPHTYWSDWDWENLVAYRTSLTSLAPLSDDDLWPAFSDPRIHASVMWSPCDIPVFGERGLAAATVPSLIIGGTNDAICPYEPDNVYLFAHLGSPDRYLLTVVNGDHVPDFGAPEITQLYTAFLNDFLKGQQEDAQYLTTEYVESLNGPTGQTLVWGPYSGG